MKKLTSSLVGLLFLATLLVYPSQAEAARKRYRDVIRVRGHQSIYSPTRTKGNRRSYGHSVSRRGTGIKWRSGGNRPSARSIDRKSESRKTSEKARRTRRSPVKQLRGHRTNVNH
jgi:hypothetical protein